MARLTIEIKKELCRNLLLASPLYQKAKDTIKARAELVERIRVACLEQQKTSDEQIEKVCKAVKSIKGFDGFVAPLVRVSRTKSDASDVVIVALNGESRSLSTDGIDRLWDRNRGTHRITDIGYFGSGIAAERIADVFVPTEQIILVDAEKFHDELCASDVSVGNLFSELEEFRLKVLGALKEISTTNQLEKHWPESVEYLPEIVRPTKKEVALSVDTLNAICGIPK